MNINIYKIAIFELPYYFKAILSLTDFKMKKILNLNKHKLFLQQYKY